MKKLMVAAAIVGTFATVSFVSVATSAPAVAREAFSFSFDTGNGRFGYSDGYWDHNRQWHRWRSAREAREFRTRYGDRYRNARASRMRNRGWMDSDYDGVPNRYDRDRDDDGVPNRRDDSPNNPYRR